ncbi:RHS repeat protein [Hymenobacter sp. BT664]|uniref:RHS repeat protein n=1 Tax=Hymenobacter montanus TaxID=2771359 RepID=A0A927GJT0_9BACT|nr:RHS repeat domain-containing protein [Hymenobacter montanus]MBD2768431.1 RHS repeat protein [Hymenobacter montanus]
MKTPVLGRLGNKAFAGALTYCRTWLSAIVLLGYVSAQAQDRSMDLLPPKFVPTSPTLTSFARFDSQKLVDLPTGAAQLAVPLANITSGELQLPVSLAYSYTGLQVYQPWDLVGLGWALQAGASISVQVNGLYDGAPVGAGNEYRPANVYAGVSDQRYLKRVADGLADSAPDVYSFSLPGGASGRFVMQDTAIILLPQQPLHIRRIASGGFQITTESGIRYQFQVREQTRPNHNNFGSTFSTLGTYTSAWQLTRIISTDNADTLRFYYTNHGFELAPNRCSVTTGQFSVTLPETTGNCGSPADYPFHNVFMFPNRLESQYLDSITGRGGHLLLVRNRTSHELQRVRLIATTGGRREIRSIQLYQSHFDGNTSTEYRLRLDSLQESANGMALPAYRFFYVAGDMLARGSAAQDYWGYANGAIRNGDYTTTTVPTLLADPRLGSLAADRRPNFLSAVAGALEQVRYPTGGTSRWEYEPGRLAAESTDIPLVEEVIVLGPVGFDPSTAKPLDGGRIPVTTSGFLPFEVKQEGEVLVGLSRQPTESNNRLQDFNIWQRLPTGDALITNQDPGTYRAPASTDGKDFTFHLMPGNYVAKLYVEQNDEIMFLTVHMAYRDSTLFKFGLPGPGVRVRRTTTTAAGAPPLVRTYSYDSGLGRSPSGVSLLPQYGMGFDQWSYSESGIGSSGGCLDPTNGLPVYAWTRSFTITSSDNQGLGNEFNKYSFYYREVTEREGNDQGMTVSYFTHRPQQFNDVVLHRRLIYRQDPSRPGGRQLASSENYTYATDSVVSFITIRSRLRSKILPGVTIPATQEPEQYGVDMYDLHAAFEAPVLTEQLRYDEQGAVLASSTRSSYRRQRLVRMATRSNMGWDIQHYKRLSDYTARPAVVALRVNHFNPVVETQRWRRGLTDADSALVGGQLTFYGPAGRHAAGHWDLRLSQPVAGPNAERSANGAFTAFKSDTRYAPTDSVCYDPATGLLVERRLPHAPVTSYLWGYDRSGLVAQVENATYSQLIAVLGAAAVRQLAGPHPGTDAQVRQLLQPLRRQLPQARVTTFTQQSLVGLTSQTDPAGRTTFYEYDGLGRLLRTRDDQGRVLSQQQYHYAGH